MADAAPWVVLRRDELEEMLERAVRRGRELGPADEWLTADQAAELLGVKRETVVTYARRDGLPCSYAGKVPMFRRDRLHAWLEARSEERGSRSARHGATLRGIRGGKK